MIGAMGIPVFAGGKGGLVHFLGPTGGYLVGFAVAAWMVGFISERLRRSIVHDVLSVSVGALAIYGVGSSLAEMDDGDLLGEERMGGNGSFCGW